MLSLTEQRAFSLPETYGIAGIAPADGGGLLLWSAEGDLLRLDAEGQLARRRLPDSLQVAGMAVTPEGVRLLDRTTGREFLFGPDGRPALSGRVPLRETELIDHALWADGRWVLALRDVVRHQFELRDDRGVRYRSAPAESLAAVPRYQLSPGDGAYLLTRLTSPFEIVRVFPGGRADTLASPLAALAPVPADSIGSWRAMPAVGIECGILVTLAELTSDRRILVRYDRRGRMVRSTPLDAPLGLVLRVPGEATVLAARRAGALELVWYDWRWGREPLGSH